MTPAALVDELMTYLETDEGRRFHTGEDHEVCRFVDDMLPALAAHPSVRRVVLHFLEEGNPGMATHLISHLVFDLARLYALKMGMAESPEDKPPVELNLDVWGAGWESGGDL